MIGYVNRWHQRDTARQQPQEAQEDPPLQILTLYPHPPAAFIPCGSPEASWRSPRCTSGHILLTSSCFCRLVLTSPSGKSFTTSRLRVPGVATATLKKTESQPSGQGDVGSPQFLYCALSLSQEGEDVPCVPFRCLILFYQLIILYIKLSLDIVLGGYYIKSVPKLPKIVPLGNNQAGLQTQEV